MNNKNRKFIGVDWGTKRIGLAFGEGEVKIASPLGIARNINELIKIIEKEAPDILVVGKPFKMLAKGETSQEFNDFVEKLKEKTYLPIKFIDERLSSLQADSLVGDKKTKADRDAVAAMLILQTYFDSLDLGK